MADAASPAERAWRLDREDVESRLSAVVAEHRVEIAVVVPLVGAASLIAGARGLLTPAVAFSPLALLVGTAVMRLPLIAGIAPLLDRRAGALGLVLCGYAYAVEFVGVTTGWPYGEFAYGVELGPMVAGVPLALPLFFVPLVCNAYLLALRSLGPAAPRGLRLALALGAVLVIDLVLDPGAVALGFWTYGGGPYYGVPLSNYLGWSLSGAVGVLLLDAAFDPDDVRARLAECPFLLDDLVSFVLLWGLVNLAFANWLPVALAGGLVAVLVAVGHVELPFVSGSAGV